MTARRPLALAVLAAAALAGCGGEGSNAAGGSSSEEGASENAQAQIEDAVTGFYDALAAEDASAACTKLTAEGQGELVRFAASADRGLTGAGCEEAVKRSFLAQPDGDYGQVGRKALQGIVSIDGDSARITARDRLPLRLVKEEGKWVLDSLGLKPQVASGQLTATEEVALSRANVEIAKFCADAVGYLSGVRSSLPSDRRFQAKSRGVETLIRLAQASPEAKTSQGDTMRDVLLEAAAVLENGNCDRASARRLSRTAAALP